MRPEKWRELQNCSDSVSRAVELRETTLARRLATLAFIYRYLCNYLISNSDKWPGEWSERQNIPKVYAIRRDCQEKNTIFSCKQMLGATQLLLPHLSISSQLLCGLITAILPYRDLVLDAHDWSRCTPCAHRSGAPTRTQPKNSGSLSFPGT